MNKAVQIVRVYCVQCPRQFRTVPSVVEHSLPSCPDCGAHMRFDEPQDVSVLRKAS